MVAVFQRQRLSQQEFREAVSSGKHSLEKRQLPHNYPQMEQKHYDNMSVEEQVTAELIAIDVIATLRGCTRDEAMNLLY